MKPHIHFHSDCSFFAGCENMLVNFFNDDSFVHDYYVTFSYRYSIPYEKGYRNRVKNKIKAMPLNLLDISDFTANVKFLPIKILIFSFYHLLFLKYLFVCWNTLILFKAFGKEKIDLLHINSGGYPGAYSGMSAVFAARMRGIKRIVFVVNNIALSYKTPRRWIDYPLDRIVSRSVSVFVTGSAYAKQKLIEVLKLPSKYAVNIHNGIAPREVTESRAEVISRLGVEDNQLLFAVIAVLEERKGHFYLFKALELLRKQGIKIPIFLIEGTGSKLESLQLTVRDFGLFENVKFIGTETNVFNLLNAVDVLILPSVSYEDFPNVTLEAMSLGKAVIASCISGIPEQIEHMVNGILVKPKDVNGLADAILQIMENKDLRHHLGENALKKFEEKFMAKVSVDNYRSLYTNLLRKEAK